jgi:drug/metabolite transporter (DMT)-like permease
MDAPRGKRLWRDPHRPRDLEARRMNPYYGFVAVTVILTVYAQMIVKWQVGKAGHLPSGTSARLHYLGHILLNPWVISALLGGLLAAFSWIAALSRLELSRAYPLTAASFVLIVVLSAIFFDERLTPFKVAGVLLIVLGLIVGSQT